MKLLSHPLLPLTGMLVIAACSPTYKPPRISYDSPPQRAVLLPDPPKPVDIIQVPTPLPLPGQLEPVPTGLIAPPELPDPTARVAAANAAARMQPIPDDYINAIQVYPFTDGALYEVYAAPEEITDCQSASKRDPLSACKKDPFDTAVLACPGSEQEGPARPRSAFYGRWRSGRVGGACLPTWASWARTLERRRGVQTRFLKRQLSLPVSMMSQ